MTAWNCKGNELIQEIQNTVPAPGSAAFWFLGQVGFAVKYQDKIILIDPVLNDITLPDGASLRMYEPPFSPNALKADFVLCTHGHLDHMAEETLTGLLQANPEIRIVIPAGCRALAASFGIPDENLVMLQPKERTALTDSVSVFAMSAAHPTHIHDGNHPDMALSYQITLGGSEAQQNSQKRLIHLGDTYLTNSLYHDLCEAGKPDILMMPINGNDYFRQVENIIGNMEAEEAAKLACALEAGLAVPMHYDMIRGNLANPLRFAEKMRELNPAGNYLIPVLGQQFRIY